MKFFSELIFLENSFRRKSLLEYRAYLEIYFRLIDYDTDGNIIDSDESRPIRTDLNKLNHRIQGYIQGARVSVHAFYTPQPITHQPRQRVNIIDNLFGLQHYDFPIDEVIDMVDKALGVYEGDYIHSIIRTFNPFYWIGRVLELISSIPFYLLGSVGFNRTQIEKSILGRITKWLIKLVTLLLLAWDLLSRLQIVPAQFNFLVLISSLFRIL